MIAESVTREDDFESILAKFDGKVGLEGRALISLLIAQRDGPDAEEQGLDVES